MRFQFSKGESRDRVIFRASDRRRRETGRVGSRCDGVTYKALDIDLHCPVTLKVISEKYLGDESARVRFLREARAAAKLRHSNVASVVTGSDDKTARLWDLRVQKMKIGYARVSTLEQNLDLQLQALNKAGCRRVFQEKISGSNRNRPEFRRMLDHIREEDIIVVWKLDRLARSTRDLLKTMEVIREAGGKFLSISEPLG